MAANGEQALLDFLPEPVFVLSTQGMVVQANVSGRRLLGLDPVGRNFFGFVASPADEFRGWLKQCTGTSSPIVGGLLLRCPDGTEQRFRLQGARLRATDNRVRIGIRFGEPESDKFSILKRELDQLNSDARAHRRRQALLEEALGANQVMLRELNHRVKNNIQLLVSLFSAAIRETSSQEVKDTLQAANRRLLAVGAAQDLMYATQQMTTVTAAPLVKVLTTTISATLGQEVRMDILAKEGTLSNEVVFPLALIMNELLTNAAKHGRGKISVAFDRCDDDFSLIVQDNGPGVDVDDGQRRSSGLGLVRGLCRQIGGQLIVENNGGARITVRFTAPQGKALLDA